MTAKPLPPEAPTVGRPNLLYEAQDVYWDAVVAWANVHDPKEMGARDFANAALAAAKAQRAELAATSNALGSTPASTERYVDAIDELLRESLIEGAIAYQHPPERLPNE